MAQITFGFSDETKLAALKIFAATLEGVKVIKENNEPFHPFSKQELDSR